MDIPNTQARTVNSSGDKDAKNLEKPFKSSLLYWLKNVLMNITSSNIYYVLIMH